MARRNDLRKKKECQIRHYPKMQRGVLMENQKMVCVLFDTKDTLEERLKKAAHVKPSPAQLAWMEKEFIGFVHYGPNTFNDRQWGNGSEKVTDFRPSDLDVEQWCKVCSEAGMKMLVYTAKHHDGFCQWDTKTTTFSTMQKPLETDVLKLVEEGCRKYGMQLGVYLSPWDMHERERGIWPTEAYNDLFLAQLQELLSQYGKIDEVWFDGACGDYEIWKAVPAYKPKDWYSMIKKLQPSAVVRLYDPYFLTDACRWSKRKDGIDGIDWDGIGVRWVGNENGISRENEWSVQPVIDYQIAENATWKDLGEEKYYADAVGAIWYPVEVNTILLNQWFYNAPTSVARPLKDLVDVYYNAIGNNGTLLLNISPNVEGALGEDQIKRLKQLKDYTDETFRVNLALGARLLGDNGTKEHGLENLINGDKFSYWMPDGDWRLQSDTRAIIIELDGEKTFDQVMLQEFIREGQRVAGWKLEAWIEGRWMEVTNHKTIGYKTIRRFPMVTTDKVRLTITRSWDTPMLNGFGLYLSAKLPAEEKTEKLYVVHSVCIEEKQLQQGLQFNCYKGGVQSAALIENGKPQEIMTKGTTQTVTAKVCDKTIDYSVVYTGYICVPKEGKYTFSMENADGAQVYLGGQLFLNNDEPHEKRRVSGYVQLEKGYCELKILYTSFRNEGAIRLFWQRQGVEMREMPKEVFFHLPG